MKTQWKPLFAGLVVLATLLTGCSSVPAQTTGSQTPAVSASGGPLSFKDMGGRDTELAAPANLAFGAGPPATVMIYTFGADKLAGWNTKVTEQVSRYVTPEAAALPVLGRANGKDGTFNAETLLGHGVNVILDAGEVSTEYAKIDDDLEQQSGIQVVQLSTELQKLPESYRMMGRIFGDDARGEQLAGYTERINAELARGSAAITDEQRVSVYYATGDAGLSTAGGKNIHAQVIDVIGARNVYGTAEKASGRVDVNAEQLLTWDPDWIITMPGKGGADLASSDAFKSLRAVSHGNVLTSPQAPWAWMDGPPSVNQVIGAVWAAETIYPDTYNFDLPKEVKEFYSLFYHHELTDSELNEILSGAGRRN